MSGIWSIIFPPYICNRGRYTVAKGRRKMDGRENYTTVLDGTFEAKQMRNYGEATHFLHAYTSGILRS